MNVTPDPERVADEDSISTREPTLREMRATLGLLWMEIDNNGGIKTSTGQFYKRVYTHMSWLLDAYLFDVDGWADDGRRS